MSSISVLRPAVAIAAFTLVPMVGVDAKGATAVTLQRRAALSNRGVAGVVMAPLACPDTKRSIAACPSTNAIHPEYR
jgi:hypothetical protein